VQFAQAVDFVVDAPGLHRAAAGAVNAQHHAGDVLVVVSGAQRLDDQVRVGLGAGGDDAVQLHQCGVPAGDLRHADVGAEQAEYQQDQQQRQQAEKDPPAPGAALLDERVAQQALEHLAFPGRRLSVVVHADLAVGGWSLRRRCSSCSRAAGSGASK
jgi:hypothetical protein